MNNAAWLMHCGVDLRLAVGDREMIELVRGQNCFPVPGAPVYCDSVLAWQGLAVPVMDLERLRGGSGVDDANGYICVLNYQAAPGHPLQAVGIRVDRAPERIQVDDEQACGWPQSLLDSRLRSLGLCCFEHRDEVVLVIDIGRLCSAEFRDLASAA